MGFWKAVAKGFLDDKEYKRATAAQDAYNATIQPGPSRADMRRRDRQADDDANAWLGMLDASRTVMDARDEQIREDRRQVEGMKHYVRSGCFCGDPNCDR